MINKDKIPSKSNIVDINTVDSKDNIAINKGSSDFMSEKYYTKKIFDAQDFKKFVKKVESIIRYSTPYKQYIAILKDEYKLTECAVMGGIDDDMASIEFHHYPFSLYDIVSIVLKKKLNNGEKVSTLTVAQEVVELHFQNKVGVVSLSITAHELAHDGNLFINMSQVFGKVDSFMKSYLKEISLEQIKNYNKLIELSKSNDTDDNGFLKVDIQDNRGSLEKISLLDVSKAKKK